MRCEIRGDISATIYSRLHSHIYQSSSLTIPVKVPIALAVPIDYSTQNQHERVVIAMRYKLVNGKQSYYQYKIFNFWQRLLYMINDRFTVISN